LRASSFWPVITSKLISAAFVGGVTLANTALADSASSEGLPSIWKNSRSLSVPAGSETVLPLGPLVTESKTGAASKATDQTLVLRELVLASNSSVVFPPFKSIFIQNLIAADGARIKFPILASGADGKPGNSGDGVNATSGGSGGDGVNLPFFVAHLEGHVVIEAQGGDGAAGKAGRDGRQGPAGRKGQNAPTLFFGLFYLGDGDDGGAGYQGEKGGDGGNGGNGGAGGQVWFYYIDKAAFADIAIEVSGGRGGSAGSAGFGGLGGDGGPAGKGIQDGRQGPMGMPGIPGKPGKPGRPGASGNSSIYQLDPELFACLVQLHARSTLEDLTDDDFNGCRSVSHLQTTLTPSPVLSPVPPTLTPSPRLSPDVALTPSPTPAAPAPTAPASATPALKIVSGGKKGLHVWNDLKENVAHLDADGEDGEAAASTWIPGNSGDNGTSASSGGAITMILHALPARIQISAKGGNGGAGANAASGVAGMPGQRGRDETLAHGATKGADGSAGGPGGNGGNGGHGGSGGQIKIVYIPEPPSSYDPQWISRIDFDVSGGLGGEAASGGKGGFGGVAGKGGRKFFHHRAAAGKHGPQGPDVMLGKSGEFGSDGKIEFWEAGAWSDWIIDDFKRMITIMRSSRTS